MIIKVFRNTKKYGAVKLTFDEKSFKLYQKYNWWLKDQNNKYSYLCRDCVTTGKKFRFHRELLNLTDKNLVCDHINGDGLDNRLDNLRICTQKENIRNKNKTKNQTSSKYKGVSFNKLNNNWRVRMEKDGSQVEIGSFKTEKEAAEAYNKAAIKMYGEYAKVNVVSK